MNGRRSELAVAAMAGLTALAFVYAMVVSERAALDHALQLAAPETARPGDDVPLRAFVLEGIGLGEVPSLTEAEVRVELRMGESLRASLVLDASATRTSEGTLRAPSEAGHFELFAEARIGGERVATVRRPLAVTADAPAAPSLAHLTSPLAQFALGPLVVEPSALPPPRFEVRVAGGACVPDQPCGLLVDFGEDGHDLRVVPGAAVREAGSIAREGRTLRASVQVTGPEGDLELVALTGGLPVARRSVRLPVALATPWLSLPEPFVRGGRLVMEVAPPPGRSALIADVSRDGRFVRSVTLPEGTLDGAGRRSAELSFEGLPDGLYRVSLRADPFPTDHVADRLVRLGPAAAPPFDVEGPLAFAFAAAELEDEGLALPAPVSGLEDDRAALEDRRRLVRGLAVAAMLVAAIVLVIAVMRRGLESDAVAAAVLREAGADDHGARRQRLTLALTIAALAFALLAGVALLTVRSFLE
jgi:hypothetical protein